MFEKLLPCGKRTNIEEEINFQNILQGLFLNKLEIMVLLCYICYSRLHLDVHYCFRWGT